MKKGQQYTLGQKWLYFIVALFIIAFMFLYLRAMFQNYEAESTTCLGDVQNSLFIAETLYSENCFTYSDGERVYPGTIDWSKFTQTRWDSNCYKNMPDNVNLTLNGKNIGDAIYKPVIVNKTIYVYQDGEITPSTVSIMLEEPLC